MIKGGFGMDIPVAVISAAALSDAMAHAPAWWNADQESKHNAIFVILPATSETVCAQVGEIKPEYEKIDCHGPVIFWSAAIKSLSRTRWSRWSAPPLTAASPSVTPMRPSSWRSC